MKAASGTGWLHDADSPPPALTKAATAKPRLWLGELILTLALSDLRLRYGRGRLRIVKWLLDPFFAVGVYLVLVTLVLHRPGRTPGLSLACAVVSFQLITAALALSVWAVQARRAMIANMAFPISLVPLVSTVTESMAFASSLTLFVLLMAVYGVDPTLALLWLPVVIAANFALAVAVAYLGSLVGIWEPEMTSFLQALSRALFFLAPGLIPLSQIHGRLRIFIELNPLTGLFEAYRSVIMFGRSPAAWQVLEPIAAAILMLAVILPVYLREQRHFPKVLE